MESKVCYLGKRLKKYLTEIIFLSEHSILIKLNRPIKDLKKGKHCTPSKVPK